MKTSNKYLKVILATTALVMIFTSCQKNEETESVASKYIKVDAGMLTRATEAAFEDGDKISVYAWAGADITTALSAPLAVNNSINTLKGTTWSAEPVMVWKDMITLHYFVATYPVRENGEITNFEAYEFTLIGDKQQDDLLFASNQTGIKGEDKAVVPLVFDHSQSKLVVNLTFRNQFGGIPTVTSVSVLAKNVAIVDFFSKTTVAKTGATLSEVVMEELTTSSKYESVIVPQTVNKITITIAGQNYIYNNPTGIALVQGKNQTINLIVGRDKIELGTITINPWGNGDVIPDGEAEQE